MLSLGDDYCARFTIELVFGGQVEDLVSVKDARSYKGWASVATTMLWAFLWMPQIIEATEWSAFPLSPWRETAETSANALTSQWKMWSGPVSIR